MIKNNFTKILSAGLVLLTLSFSIVSCSQKEEEPTPAPVKPDTPTPTENFIESDLVFTGKTFAELSALIRAYSDKISAAGEAGKEYVIDVRSALTTTAADNVLDVVLWKNTKINLYFSKAPVTKAAPLTIKDKWFSNEAVSEPNNELTITMPDASALDVNIQTPLTTVYLNTSGSATTYKKVVATVSDKINPTTTWWGTSSAEDLFIGKNVTVNELQLLSGEAYALKGGKVGSCVFDIDNPNTNIYFEDINASYDLKVVKGSAGTTTYNMPRRQTPDKLTIGDGVTVTLNGLPKEIVGEGKQTATVDFNIADLTDVDALSFSNVIVTSSTWGLLDMNLATSFSNTKISVPVNFEGFKKASAGVSGAEFDAPILIEAPSQTEDITDFVFNFSGCAFTANATFTLSAAGATSGTPTARICYWDLQTDGTWAINFVYKVSDLPASVQAAGEVEYDRNNPGLEKNIITGNYERVAGYWYNGRYDTIGSVPTRYTRYYVTTAFNGCTGADKKALTLAQIQGVFATDGKAGVKYLMQLGNKEYIWDGTTFNVVR